MSDISSVSRSNYARHLGETTRIFIEQCGHFSITLSDRAEAEKSKQLRLWMNKTSGQIEKMIEDLREMLEPSQT